MSHYDYMDEKVLLSELESQHESVKHMVESYRRMVADLTHDMRVVNSPISYQVLREVLEGKEHNWKEAAKKMQAYEHAIQLIKQNRVFTRRELDRFIREKTGLYV